VQTIDPIAKEKSLVIYLKKSFANKMKDKGNLSQIAKNMGYRSPSLVSMIINGKRKPSLDFIQRFSKEFELDAFEKEDLISHLSTTSKFQNTMKLQKISFTNEELEQKADFLTLLNTISLSKIELPLDSLRKKLNLQIKDDDIKRLKTLFSINGYLRKKGSLFSFHKTNDSLKALKLQVSFIELALTNLKPENILKNVFGQEQVLIKEEEVDKAKKELDNFLKYFVSKYHSYDEEDFGPNELYQLNLQFFSLAENL